MNSGAIESLLREKEVAKILNVSIGKVRHLRLTGGGPAFIKIGDSVRYKPEEIRKFIDSIVLQTVTKKREPIGLSEIFEKESE